MAGHSHWANISRKKALVDNKRGKLWSKLAQLIIVAARSGGGDPAMNLRLRYAIDDAKAVSMPKDNIERAIKTGTGELKGDDFEEIIYEGYGPGGVAVMCEILTNKRSRTAPEIRNLFERHGGNMGSTGCVGYLFDKKGLVTVAKGKADEERLMEIALEAGGEDVQLVGESYEITCPPEDFTTLREAFKDAGIETESAEVTRIPQTTVELDADTGRAVLALLEKLDEHDDVQQVYSNYSIPDEVMAELAAE